MSATTKLQFTLTSPGSDPVPTPTPTPTPTPGYYTSVVGSPNTGENSASSDNGGGTVFTALFAVIGLAALVVFLVKYLKKNRHVSFAERGSFHISARPRVFATVALTLAVAFLGGITLTNMYNNAKNTNAASQRELEVVAKSNITFNVDRGQSSIESDTIEVKNNGAKYDLYVSTTDNKFARDASAYLDPVSSTITSPSSDISENQWGMSLKTLTNPDVSGQNWAAAPTTETKVKSDATESTTPAYYAVNLGSDLPDGTYATNVTYRAVAKNYKVTVINGFVNETGDKTEDWFDADVEVRIRENCSATQAFKVWTIREGLKTAADITLISNRTYKFTMPANDVTVEATCEGDEPDPTAKWEIHYDKNISAATGTMDPTIVTGTSEKLRVNAFTYANHVFKGWACTSGKPEDETLVKFSDNQSVTQATLEAAGCQKTPGNGETNPPTSDYYTVYAIWGTSTPDDPKYIQDVTPDMCDNMAVLEDKTLPDRRDNKQYTYRKYADGRCWMLSDLAYKPANDVKLTAVDTDISSDKTATFSALGGKYVEKNGQVLYNYKAATAGEWNNQAANTIIADSLCPASWKIPDAWRGGDTPGFGNMSGEFWNLTIRNIGKTNGGGDKRDQGDPGWFWMQAFTFANDNQSFTYRGTSYSNLHGPHFGYNGAWDFTSNDWANIGGTTGTAGTYGSYFLNTITKDEDTNVNKPAAFNPQKNGPDYWDINVTVPDHGSSVRCVLRTKEQRADMGGNRAAPGPDKGDITKND